MGVEAALTALAERQVDELRGRRFKAFDAFMADLENRGCAAISGRTGYRLSGDFPVNRVCSQHLYERDRAIVAFESPEIAVVITVGPHLEGDPRNVYGTLWDALGLAAPPSDESLKPDCCNADGVAPLLPADEIQDVMQRCRQLARLLT